MSSRGVNPSLLNDGGGPLLLDWRRPLLLDWGNGGRLTPSSLRLWVFSSSTRGGIISLEKGSLRGSDLWSVSDSIERRGNWTGRPVRHRGTPGDSISSSCFSKSGIVSCTSGSDVRLFGNKILAGNGTGKEKGGDHLDGWKSKIKV